MSYKAEKTKLFDGINSVIEIKEAINLFEQNFWLLKHSFLKGKLILYHYTTAEGMKGIINGRSFWCTDVNFVNDELELKYGKKIILKKLNGYLQKENDSSIKKLLNRLIKITEVQNTYDTYIACFSENDNLLKQWERYAANGNGYNLGIHFTSDLVSRTKINHYLDKLSENYYPVLRKVFYEIDEQYDIVDKYIDAIINGAKEALTRKGKLYKSWDASISLDAVNTLLEIMFSLKSPSYKEEREWRLVYMITKNYKPELRNIRENNGLPIPYLNTFVYVGQNMNYEFPIQSINIGPKLAKETTIKSLEIFLNNINSSSNHPIKINTEIKIKRATRHERKMYSFINIIGVGLLNCIFVTAVSLQYG